MTTKPPAAPSKFAADLLKRIDNFAVVSNRTDMCELAIDQALAPVRECLKGLKQRDLSTGPCWCQSGNLPNSFLEDPAKWKHSDACLAAQQLYERLKTRE